MSHTVKLLVLVAAATALLLLATRNAELATIIAALCLFAYPWHRRRRTPRRPT